MRRVASRSGLQHSSWGFPSPHGGAAPRTPASSGPGRALGPRWRGFRAAAGPRDTRWAWPQECFRGEPRRRLTRLSNGDRGPGSTSHRRISRMNLKKTRRFHGRPTIDAPAASEKQNISWLPAGSGHYCGERGRWSPDRRGVERREWVADGHGRSPSPAGRGSG